MEHDENLVADVGNENTDQFAEMTQEEEDEEGDALAKEESEIIPTTMLTPPPTGEPLLNGSSRSNTNCNDLQQFTTDELTQQSPGLSHHTDEGNSNQSANSDSADSKLIINEGSVDSSDISNTVDGRVLEVSTGVHLDDGKNTPLIETKINQKDDILEVQRQVLNEVLPADEVIMPLESASAVVKENDAVENCKNVPSQSINGVVHKDDGFTSTIDYEKENRLANETHTEHRKLKRKLSDSILDPFETSQKHTKFNNQTNNIGLSDNQIVTDDLISNRLINHDQITDSCDNSTSSDVQKNQDAKEKSQENAGENFESELAIEDLLSVAKEKNIDECDHIYMNGHTGRNMELISLIETPNEYNQQLAKNDSDESFQSHALKSKVKNPFSTPPQSETNSISDNSDEKPLEIQPEKLETSSLVEKSTNTIRAQYTDIAANLTQAPLDYGIVSNTTMNINSNSDINAPHTNTPSINRKFYLASENIGHPKATPQIQKVGKKINTQIRIRRQVFLCSACGTYYEKWNLFYHIREVHNKFMCLFENCLGIFPNAERLVNHLESKHVHKPFVYEHKDDLLKSLQNQCFLMCCVCEHIFTENDDVTAHSCETFMKPCSVCGLTFIHKSNCSALLSNKSTKHKQKRMTVAPNIVQQIVPNTMIADNKNQMSQQTFLRNALLGQEPRVNHYGDHQNAPIIAQMPISDRRLNNALHNVPSQQTQYQHQQQHQHQIHPQFQPAPVSISINTMDARSTEQSLVR